MARGCIIPSISSSSQIRTSQHHLFSTPLDQPQAASEVNMASPNTSKRCKGIEVYRPFVHGTIAKPFNDETNPKPPGIPAEHTHSWTVFVKGVDNKDITHWCKKVQFKLHESIPNPLRSTFPLRSGQSI